MSDRATFFAEERWTAGVIGLGYVGLPLLLTAMSNGLDAIGFDVSEDKVRQLSTGHSPIDDVSDEALSAAIAMGVRFTSDPEVLGQADAIFICVPSPLGRNRQPDLSYIEAAADTVTAIARPGQLISLESTTYPGTTEDYLIPAVERAGLTVDEDVWVAFSPERVSPGDDMKTGDIPKVVGGVTPGSGDVAEAAYRRLVPSVHRVSSARAAELSKLLENTYRAVNIGLINEIAQLSHELDIDIWEVVDAAATKPFGFQAFYPGPGVGGHCIPLDPQYLAWRAREANFATRFIETADQVNTGMPEYTAQRIADLLNSAGKAVLGSRILVVGVAYKPNVSDDRESASVDVAQRLLGRGAQVVVLDPHLTSERIEALGFEPAIPGESLAGFDLAAILTDHANLPYSVIARDVPLVFDSRGVYRRLGITAPNVEAL
ncbi:MAG TPA: nucleotide sugar dehydrogenase [Acidimicrobiia bacterium]